MSIHFFSRSSEYWIWKSWQIWLYKLILTKRINCWITCNRKWKPKNIFKNNNSAATTVVRSDKARTRGMEICTEDEDSWEDKNFKWPYCSQELISQDNLIKHMSNKHLKVIFPFDFILFKTTINYMCSHLYLS